MVEKQRKEINSPSQWGFQLHVKLTATFSPLHFSLKQNKNPSQNLLVLQSSYFQIDRKLKLLSSEPMTIKLSRFNVVWLFVLTG